MRKREHQNIGLAQNEESCVACNKRGSCLAEFNWRLLCARCFGQLLEIRVGYDAIAEDNPRIALRTKVDEILSVA